VILYSDATEGNYMTQRTFLHKSVL